MFDFAAIVTAATAELWKANEQRNALRSYLPYTGDVPPIILRSDWDLYAAAKMSKREFGQQMADGLSWIGSAAPRAWLSYRTACKNCGAPIQRHEHACSYCRSEVNV